MLRLRQVAFAAADLARAEQELEGLLGVERCFRDPGVGHFGLHNALFAVGDQFLEIVAPLRDGTTAGRLLAKRGGDCGYMVLFQTDDLASVEARAAEHEVRVVFEAIGEGIRGLHLHPKDVPGAIVSIDESDEPAEWPWAGPSWRDHVVTDTVAAIVGVEVADDDPSTVADAWARVLGVDAIDRTIAVDDASIRFVSPLPGGRQGLVGLDVRATDRSLVGSTAELLGVTITWC